MQMPTCTPRKDKSIPSLIKWTGSKRSQAKPIANLMPKYTRYIEPFLGGGALLFLAARKGSIASDVYPPLIDFWKKVQTSPDEIIHNYSQQWTELQRELDSIDRTNPPTGTPKYFYLVRKRFNEKPNPFDLCFLMRTCVNGFARFNKKGEFNNSFHSSRNGMTPDNFSNGVIRWSLILDGVDFLCQDYGKTVANCHKGDFVYFDPPYLGNKQRYTESLNLERFLEVLERLNGRDVKWALSLDGIRGNKDFTFDIPKGLYKRRYYLESGNSPAKKVLNDSIEIVSEALYLNYE